MGALTIKPLAYKARSWELATIEIVNFLDTYCGNIAIQKRGGEIIRILPSRKDTFFWISDRIRFCFESLKKQRVTYPYIILENKYTKINWKNIIVFIKYMKYVSDWMVELNRIEDQLKKKERKIYNNVFINEITPRGDLISNIFIQILLQTRNLIKYEDNTRIENPIGNINKKYYTRGILNQIKNSKYNVINNICIINDYPRLWSYIKVNKILWIGVKKNVNLSGYTLSNNNNELIKIEKYKNILGLFSTSVLIFTEKKINVFRRGLRLGSVPESYEEYEQVFLTKDTEELTGGLFSNKVDDLKLDKDLINWRFRKGFPYGSNRRGIVIDFLTHGSKSNYGVLLPITNFIEEYSVRYDSYGESKKSTPVNMRGLNMRRLSQILHVMKIIFKEGIDTETTIEKKFIKDIVLLKYGEIQEKFKGLSDFIEKPLKKEKNINVFKDTFEFHEALNEILTIKKETLKKKNNYVC